MSVPLRKPTERDELFAATRWTMVLEAGDSAATSTQALSALSELCQIYWRPLYAFLRKQGYGSDDAQDLTQGFFAHLIETRAYAHADREKGRFRSFLLGVLKHFIADTRDRRQALKRGGGMILEKLDETKQSPRRRRKSGEQPNGRQMKFMIASGRLPFCGKRWVGSRKSAHWPGKRNFLAT